MTSSHIVFHAWFHFSYICFEFWLIRRVVWVVVISQSKPSVEKVARYYRYICLSCQNLFHSLPLSFTGSFYIYLDQYKNVLSENMSTLTRILPNHAFDKSNGPESNQQERKEGKEKGEEKTEHSYVSISPTLETKNVCQEKVSPLASHDGQRRALPLAEVISIVFINLGRYITKGTKYWFYHSFVQKEAKFLWQLVPL